MGGSAGMGEVAVGESGYGLGRRTAFQQAAQHAQQRLASERSPSRTTQQACDLSHDIINHSVYRNTNHLAHFLEVIFLNTPHRCLGRPDRSW